MNIGSLRRMAIFLLEQPDVPDPQVGIGPAGTVQVEWTLSGQHFGHPGGGLLALEFLPTDTIRFAAISAPHSVADRFTVYGNLPAKETWHAVRMFVDAITNA